MVDKLNNPFQTSELILTTNAIIDKTVVYDSSISAIEGKIPAQATNENKLADKNFVNSSIATNTAYFIGTFESLEALEAYSGTVTNNDYAFVITIDSTGNSAYNRYKYTTATNPASWEFEYTLNNSSFTSDQWAAINSGATSTNITAIANKQDILVSGTNIKTINNESILGSGNITIGGGSEAAWGSITGTLSDQTDLQTALNAKAADNTVVKLTGDQSIAGNKSFTGTTAVVTPAVSDNSTKPATTAYIETKFKVVSTLPASPDVNTYYFIPES